MFLLNENEFVWIMLWYLNFDNTIQLMGF